MKLKIKILIKVIASVFIMMGIISFGARSANAMITIKIEKETKVDEFRLNKVLALAKCNSLDITEEVDTYDDENVQATSGANDSTHEIINYAHNFLGKPYVYGANGPNSFDCSGFTSYVFRHFGVTIPRTSQEQFGAGTLVAKSKLKAADLVFFNTYSNIGHVGIYIGNGDFIHAASSGSVKVSSLSEGYYNDRYAGARRLL